jgi:predicted metal-dependent RNase
MFHSQYIIVQLVNGIKNEHLNIGILSYDCDLEDGYIYQTFTSNWKRLQAAFGNARVTEDSFKLIIENFSHLTTKSQLLEYIKEIKDHPYSILCFSEPRAAITDPQFLMEDMAKTFLS